MLSSSVFKFPKYALSVYSVFGSTQYSRCLTACLSWQKIQLQLFKIVRNNKDRNTSYHPRNVLEISCAQKKKGKKKKEE